MASVLTPKARGIEPVRTGAVAKAAAELLAADAAFLAHLGAGDAVTGAHRLHAQYVPLRSGDGAESDAAPVWCLVREMDTVGPGGRRAQPGGLVRVTVQVQVSADESAVTDGGGYPPDVLATAHELAYAALQDEPLAGRSFRSEGLIWRTDEPSPPRLDPASERLYSSALFSINAVPVPS